MSYRPEIDGLRAIAVLSVIASHAGFDFFRGGFVGVDIFFAISGYLITYIIVKDIEKKRFSVRDFYERRARRIVPALFAMLLACLPFAWIILLPNEFQQFFESFLATIFFGSNFYFWLQGSDYFAMSAETQPLLHTWSLGVEEQFYLVFPIFLLLVWRLGRKKVFWTIALIGLFSLALSEWASGAGPVANFYLLPTRAWELLAGTLGALFVHHKGRRSNNFLSLVGLTAILGAIFLFDKTDPFPSLYAVLPVGGALLVLIFAGTGTIANRLLSALPLAAVGLVSYSAYLWHQPIFAFARLASGRPLGEWTAVLLIVAILVLSMLSYHFIEKPFREKARIQTRVLVSTTLIVTLALGTVGYIGANGDGFRDRWEPAISKIQWTSLSDRISEEGYVPCQPYVDTEYPELSFCEYGDTDSSDMLVVYGDSHLDAISYQLDIVAAGLKLRIVDVNFGCGVIFDITRVDDQNKKETFERCNEGFDQLLGFLDSVDAKILVVSRWTFQMFPAPGYVEDLGFDNGIGGVEFIHYRENVAITGDGISSMSWESKRAATIKMLEGLATSADQVYVNYPIPEIGWDIFRENLLFSRVNGRLLPSLEFPSEEYYSRNNAVISVLEEVASGHENVQLVRADKAFCEDLLAGYCVAQTADSIFYLDDDHLSDSGAELFLKKVSLFRRLD